MRAVGVLIVVAVLVAVVAAFRGTWSPCGMSMLSTVTPLAEAGRGHRYSWTASWFFGGAVMGGATTGVVSAMLAAGVHAIGLTSSTTYAVAAAAAVIAAAVDGAWIGPPIPHHRRQVNEDWLGRYRAWVYGIGFGWQIGTGLATYIMTAGVYLVVLLGALTGSPAVAFGVCVVFGACRGSMVLAGATITSAERLRRFHERFEAWREPVRRAVIAVEIVATAVLGLSGGTASLAWAIGAAGAATVAGVVRMGRRTAPAPMPDACSVPSSVA